jgi:hypothetical protein
VNAVDAPSRRADDALVAGTTWGDVERARVAARLGEERSVDVDGQLVAVRHPFPSPPDWRDVWIYFAMLDRFNNNNEPPRAACSAHPRC